MNALWTPQYYQKVLALNPIVYWMLDEKSGTVAYDLVSERVASVQNGTHSAGVDHMQDGIGDGRTASGYDGANDYTDIYSVVLNADFDGDKGTLLIWPRVSEAGVWTDSTVRVCVQLFADANNFVRLGRSSTNNQLSGVYRAGATTIQRVINGLSTLDNFHFGITWDATTDEVRVYYNGVQQGATLAGLGVWAGNLDNVRCLIGANTQVPANAWDGYQAHCPVFDRALSPAEIAELYIVL